MPALNPVGAHHVEEKADQGFQRLRGDSLVPPVSSNTIANVYHAGAFLYIHRGDAANGLVSVGFQDNGPLIKGVAAVGADPVLGSPDGSPRDWNEPAM